MAAASNSSLNRAQIAHLVRESLKRHRSSGGTPSAFQVTDPLVLNISARHCHLSQESVEVFFGNGRQLTPNKGLYQGGQYAAEESVILIGPRSCLIHILGLCCEFDQVELASTDAISLSFKIPVSNADDIAGTSGCVLMEPAVFLERLIQI